MGIFHGLDEWKSAMMTLPEDVFFDLLRSVFGHVKTPFNKQNLLADLTAFLSRDDIRRNIAAYIDYTDAQVIAAVTLLGNPGVAELEQFFAGEDRDIVTLLLNLEERFILYRYRDGPLFRLGLNPVLEPLLKDLAEDLSGIFLSLPLEDGEGAPDIPANAGNPYSPGSPGNIGGRGTVPLDDRFFAALISFVLEEGNLFRQEGRRTDNRRVEGRLRKKILDSAGRIFPGFDLELMIRGLLCLGLCRSALWGGAALPEGADPLSPGAEPADTASFPTTPFSTAPFAPGPEGELFRPDDHVLGAFRDLEPRQRLIYWAAGLCLGMDSLPDPVPAPRLLRGRIRCLARLIDSLLGFLSPRRVYPLQTLRRILFFLERETGDFSAGFSGPGQGPLSAASGTAGQQGTSFPPAGTGASAGLPAGSFGARIDTEKLCAALVQTGLLYAAPQGYCLAGAPPPSAEPGAPDKQNTGKSPAPVLVIDAPLFCLLYPGINFSDALTLAFFTVVRETGRIFRFEITRESCLRGFERGMSAADMEELLTRLSGTPPEAPLLWTLRDWEKRSSEVSLFEGAVLALSPERRYLLETEALKTLIRRELTPGLYLLDSGDRAAEALRKAGVDIFTRYTGQAEAGRRIEDPVMLQDGGLPGLLMGGGPFPALGKTRPEYREAGISAITDPSPDRRASSEGESGKTAEVLKDRFRRALAGCRLSATERNELAARIERRLVLAESQLSPESVRGEKLEARDLDYVGKASIAKQALSSRSQVEVLFPSADGGGEQRIVGLPLALEKSGGESVLVIGDLRRPGEAPRTSGNPAQEDTIRIPGDTIRIPLGKISLLRRIKKSMFEI
ncbi:MAG: hypothetical protein LBL56_03200 [Treponema sp.]|jgi:hypothetical protein|nr:hypothetical protein [Treponema sp.]